ncbi:MAG TPA: transcriptional regulator NrdR [Thermomicrobiales bacterium]|nr:transcriptional regulator NrdR [Thermomicrobiales bacterium]
MKCPYCQHNDSSVIDSRELHGGESIRRRRRCNVCGERFTTYERIELASFMVVKKSGRREEYNQQKLRSRLRVACTKRPVSEAQLDALIARIERELLALGEAEIPSATIGDLVMRELQDLDQIAYIRFASVYRNFADLADLRRAVDQLAQDRVNNRRAEGDGGDEREPAS